MSDRYITPSKVTAWLDCGHFLTLKHRVEAGLLELPEAGGLSAFSRLLMDKGQQHELACREDYIARGMTVFDVPAMEERETFAAWHARVGDVFCLDVDVLYQVPMIHDGMRGVADFLERKFDDSGQVTWEPVDAKLAREAAKPGHVLQLCFYADAVEATTGHRPEQMHLWLGSRARQRLRVEDFGAYWRRFRASLAAAVAAPLGDDLTRPEPCAHCSFCEFADVCDAQLRSEDSLVFVAGIRSADREALEAVDVDTVAALACRTDPVPGMATVRQQRVVNQAALQIKAVTTGAASPPYALVAPGDDPAWGRGFEQLPMPDDGDVFLDFEGHPFWKADRGLFFLFGLIERDDVEGWQYRTWWAHSSEEEGVAAAQLVEHLAARRAQHPGMHVHHYNHTERSALVGLCERHGVAQAALTQLVETGAFVDLYRVALNSVQVGTESYGLKHLERLTDYVRQAGIDNGAGAVLEYEEYMANRDQDALDRIAAYNEDDVRATQALREWLVAHRPADLPWRDAEVEPDSATPELDERVAALQAFGEGTLQHFTGDVLGYWKREWLAYLAPQLARCDKETDELLDEPDVLAGLVFESVHDRLGKNGQLLKDKAYRHSLPAQEHTKVRSGDDVLYRCAEGLLHYGSVDELDMSEQLVDLKLPGEPDEVALPAGIVVSHSYVHPGAKTAVLDRIAGAVLDGSADDAVPLAMSLLRRDVPRFIAGGGPVGGLFADDVDSMIGWVSQLDGSYVPVQGPPGTGKTFRASHLIHALITAGKRVGITGPSHYAIDNLLEAVVDVFQQHGDMGELRAVRKPKVMPSADARLPGVEYATDTKKPAKPGYNLVAGTTWLFASQGLIDNPVDVIFVDEAGQVSLCDALATTAATRSMVLLGDPLQLPQVSQASHPNGSGASVLEHVLGDAVTMPPDRGVFISETRRMHPDVCGFVSREIYEGRLSSYPSCATQTTKAGTGLRWLRAEHSGCDTSSTVEADLVAAEVKLLLGSSWTDQDGVSRVLDVGDVIVVAPYNDQVDLIQDVLDKDPTTAGVAVGTVDKFQGREAAVVFFSMATSSAESMPRTGDFLFSRNRLNVAVSRARCLAYLVCTEELLDSRARGVEEMRLISTLCAFAEECDRQAAALLPEQRLAVPVTSSPEVHTHA